MPSFYILHIRAKHKKLDEQDIKALHEWKHAKLAPCSSIKKPKHVMSPSKKWRCQHRQIHPDRHGHVRPNLPRVRRWSHFKTTRLGTQTQKSPLFFCHQPQGLRSWSASVLLFVNEWFRFFRCQGSKL